MPIFTKEKYLMNINKICLSVIIILLSLAANAYAGRLGMLLGIAKDQSNMEKALAKETKTFEKIARAIEEGRIRAGQTQDEIRRKYGGPSVAVEKSDGTERWVYKPSEKSYFENAKIYLFFNHDKVLNSIEVLE